jgi:hypothetical protein
MSTLVGFLFGLDVLCFGILGLIATIFWIWMIVDALIYEPTTGEKLLWFLVIFFLNFIGALIYFAVRKSPRTPLCRQRRRQLHREARIAVPVAASPLPTPLQCPSVSGIGANATAAPAGRMRQWGTTSVALCTDVSYGVHKLQYRLAAARSRTMHGGRATQLRMPL